jgi:hypothetical protein
VADIYIDYSTGDDSTGDGSISTPYQTIATAYTNGANGDTFHLSDSAGHPVTTSIDFSVKNITFVEWIVVGTGAANVAAAKFTRLE